MKPTHGIKRGRRRWRGWLPAAAAVLGGALAGCGGGEPAGPAPNVLLIVIDTLRADHLGCYGYFRNTSPFLDGFAASNLVFEDAFCSIPITLPSHSTILSGLYPQKTGVLRNWGTLPDSIVTLPEILRSRGYRTGAVVSTAVLKKGKNLEQGFDDYLENWGISEKVPRGEGAAWELKGLAEDADRMALEWIERDRDRPFFLFINYYDVHGPYVEDERFARTFDPDSPRFLEYLRGHYDRMPDLDWKRESITFYDRSLRYLDRELETFFARLRELGVLENALVVVTSDHGNGLFQHGDYWSHGEQLYDEHIHIPLLVKLPGKGRAGRIRGMVETVDLLPSILELAGIDPPEGGDGTSFLPLLNGTGGKERVYAMSVLEDRLNRPRPREFAVRTRDAKLICRPGGESSFYRLDRDPLEMADVFARAETDQRGFLTSLRNRGAAWYRPVLSAGDGGGGPDENTLRELKALGYITP
ncbi:MAG TPA: sulfatase [bacterium]|nr:sulfatase [bacterium]